MRPVIGIAPSIENGSNMHFMNNDNVNAIKEAGGIPFILPYGYETDIISQTAEMIDGLYLTGGNDIDPTLFDEEPHPKLGEINPVRDFYEIALINKMLEMDKPILGVCKGCQMINIALNGDMYQDIYTQIDNALLQHSQNAPQEHGSHFVNIQPDSLLKTIIGKEQMKVNSRHHQANRKPGENMIHSGVANDGVIEASESTVHHFVLGLQWHPENMAVKGNEDAKKIFTSFIKACQTT